MASPRLYFRIPFLALVLFVFGATGCSDPNRIEPGFETTAGRFTVHDINTPSLTAPNAGALMASPHAVRAGPDFSFDFAISFGADNTPRLYGIHQVVNEVLLPTGRAVGAQKVSGPFDSVVQAPNRGYSYEQPTPLAVGDIVVLEALNHPICGFTFGFPNVYAKVEVEAIDVDQRTVRVRVLANPNCGFRGLEPGIPTR